MAKNKKDRFSRVRSRADQAFAELDSATSRYKKRRASSARDRAKMDSTIKAREISPSSKKKAAPKKKAAAKKAAPKKKDKVSIKKHATSGTKKLGVWYNEDGTLMKGKKKDELETTSQLLNARSRLMGWGGLGQVRREVKSGEMSSKHPAAKSLAKVDSLNARLKDIRKK